MGQTTNNADQSSGAWAWNQTPGLRSPNPIPSDAPTQSTVNSAPIQIAFNQVPAAATPVVTTKDASGKTLTAHGLIPGTSVTVQNPG